VRYVDAPVLRDEDTDSDGDCTDSDDEHLYYCQDANFNTTALVSAAGTVVERYVYDPYGKVTIWNEARTSTVSWANSEKNEILFGGYRYDPESALYHVRNRVYHPTLGRWLQRDPLGYVDGMSLYEYCRGRPTTGGDPYGEAAPIPAAAAAATIVVIVDGVAVIVVVGSATDIFLYITNPAYREARNRLMDKIADAIRDFLKNIAKGPRGPKPSTTRPQTPTLPKPAPPTHVGPPSGTKGGPQTNPIDPIRTTPANPYDKTTPYKPPPLGPGKHNLMFGPGPAATEIVCPESSGPNEALGRSGTSRGYESSTAYAETSYSEGD